MVGPDLYVGIDAGGTRTRLALADERGEIVALGEGGPGNLHRCGPEVLGRSIVEARAAAGLGSEPASAACLGVAGARSEADRRVLLDLAEELGLAPDGRIEVTSDVVVAHRGAFGGRPGIVVIAGTGSAVLGRDGEGREHSASSWDQARDDPGSGWDLGRRAVAAGILAGPGDAQTRALWAALAPRVLAAAEEPGIAAEALEDSLAGLARHVEYVLSTLGGDLDVAAVGGLTASPVWRRAFAAALERARIPTRLVAPRADGLRGALDLARDRGRA